MLQEHAAAVTLAAESKCRTREGAGKLDLPSRKSLPAPENVTSAEIARRKQQEKTAAAAGGTQQHTLKVARANATAVRV